MQLVKSFIHGRDISKFGSIELVPIEKQLNDYLEAHPEQTIRTMDVVLGPSYKEAFVVFDIREQREKQQMPKQTKPTAPTGGKEKSYDDYNLGGKNGQK